MTRRSGDGSGPPTIRAPPGASHGARLSEIIYLFVFRSDEASTVSDLALKETKD